MLATECARVLVYRDSYLLFNKNRSLHKIIANQVEKDHLINEGILPYSYRSRQIAMVTARSMFRQFGARIITNGRRVRDDYWEFKARKQGFTEDDLASDKRPATNKPKETTAEAASTATNAMSVLAGHQLYYVENPSQDPTLLPGYGLGIGNIVPNNLYPMLTAEDLQKNYGGLRRLRQDIPATPYQDRSQPGSTAEIVSQATQAVDYNRQLRAQSAVRNQLITTDWNREHHSETPDFIQTLPPDDNTNIPAPVPQHSSPQQSMRRHPSLATGSRSSSLVPPPHRRGSSQINSVSTYSSQHPGYPSQGITQSPADIHASMPGQMPGSGQSRQQPYPYGGAGGALPANQGILNYLQQQQQAQQQNAGMWGGGSQQSPHQGPSHTPNPQNPQQSPMHSAHAQLPQQFPGQNQMSPHMARSPQHAPQMQGSGAMGMAAGGGGMGAGMGGGMQSGMQGMQNQPQMPGSTMSMAAGGGGMSGMGFQAMGAGAMPSNPYAAMNRSGMFQQPGAGSPQQFMGGQGVSAAGMGMYGGGMGQNQAGVGGQSGAGGQWGGF